MPAKIKRNCSHGSQKACNINARTMEKRNGYTLTLPSDTDEREFFHPHKPSKIRANLHSNELQMNG